MKFSVLSLFPDFIENIRQYGLIGKAIENGIIEFENINIRDFSKDKHKRVDDEIYGGGPGMLMTPDPIVSAIEKVKKVDSKIIYLSPQGRVLDQNLCKELSKEKHLIFLCGHYEGIDARVVNHFIDIEISIGDYVLTGGEIPALVLMDAIGRLVPKVLGNEMSVAEDSHYEEYLKYDVYTRPEKYRGYKVPEVLLSGNHAEIKKWREKNMIENTKNKRFDIYEKILKNINVSEDK